MDHTAIKQIQQGAGIEQAAASIEGGLAGNGITALPSDYKQHDLEAFMQTRRRARGVMATSAGSDFAQYVKAHAEEGACVFVNADEMQAVAVLNMGTPETPGHTDNRAKFVLKRTAAYSALREVAGNGMGQQRAAEFLEDWTEHIKCFNDEGVVTPSKALWAAQPTHGLQVETPSIPSQGEHQQHAPQPQAGVHLWMVVDAGRLPRWGLGEEEKV